MENALAYELYTSADLTNKHLSSSNQNTHHVKKVVSKLNDMIMVGVFCIAL